jgi:glycosyltransferase involved in cell wall biosynthesis
MHAAAALRNRYGAGVRFLLVGDGSEFDEVHRLRQELDLEVIVELPGRVPHDEVVNYYARMDVLVYPRMAADVCEVVSPLKPLEAMAMGRPVVMSDVAALADMIGDRETGLLHRKGDLADLVDKLGLIVDDPVLRSTLGSNGRAWVSAERDWSMLAETVASAYEQLGLAPTALPER